jgi:shikimate kinase
MRSLTLIGMPGSGKSAVGRIIAARLGWEFVDSDKEIEKSQGMPLQDVIDRIGDQAFRSLEEETVLKLPVGGQTVISTGGSVVYSEPAMRRLASISTVVFLDAPVEAISSHIASEAPRGIVGMPEGGLEALYRERLPRYRQHADLTITLADESPEQVAAKVVTAAGLDREAR